MQFSALKLDGLILIKPDPFKDHRGFFIERYNQSEFSQNGINSVFVQDNFSHSKQVVLRGLHFQIPPHAQDKLVWASGGEILDIAVDLRKDSKTYGKWESVILSEENKLSLFIPKGFAHGFFVKSPFANVSYKISDYYSKECERGLTWNDPDLGIDWKAENPILSEKDKSYQSFKNFISPF